MHTPSGEMRVLMYISKKWLKMICKIVTRIHKAVGKINVKTVCLMGHLGRTPGCVSLSHTYMVSFLSIFMMSVLRGLGLLLRQWCSP